MRPILLSFMLIVCNAAFAQDTTPETGIKLPQSFYIGVGISVNSFAVTGSDSYYETKIDHSLPISPAFVVGGKFYLDKSSRFFLAPRISVFSFKAEGEVDLTSGLANFHHASSYQSTIVIAPSPNLGYNVIKKTNFKWNISAGIGFDFLINPREKQVTTYTSAPARIIEHKPQPMVFVFSLGTGIDIGKNINVWLNYHPAADITKYKDKKSKLSSLQVGVAWSFSKG